MVYLLFLSVMDRLGHGAPYDRRPQTADRRLLTADG